ncbi:MULTISPECIES: rubrerythrin [Methanobacterium]|uniref:Rubrerythrin n=1 Tax=Methanobacterium bryantii TaxID=2161 RepID=A0A2A2H7R9_METBR|nr:MULTISPECIES: rubrerythrin family protein [Methanobacterium]OEC84355.1 rubrerythrin [Methanobacterium sp. A39]PAV05511.1 rubrerythrin [Methanobacterium bryantii]
MQKTLENLAKAFIGESQARNRYTIYAKVAKKEGYEQLSEIFLNTAENEREHAKWAMKMINSLKNENGEPEEIIVTADAPTTLGTTVENLKATIAGENHEYTVMYPEFANMAEKEGLTDIAKRLRAIGNVEEHHEGRFKKILEKIEAGTVFKKDKEVEWVCRKCGYVHVGMKPPEECPSCDHPTKYFQILCEEY